MKQAKLVKIAIDVLINGEYDKHYDWKKVLGNKELKIYNWGELILFHCDSHKNYSIYFDKKIKNMGMLVVLLRDWNNKNNNRYKCLWYKLWIEKGTKG